MASPASGGAALPFGDAGTAPPYLSASVTAAAPPPALDGLGLIVLAEFAASHYLASGALVRVLPDWQCPSLPLHLVTPTTRKRAARVQAFMDWAHALLLRRLGSQLDSH